MRFAAIFALTAAALLAAAYGNAVPFPSPFPIAGFPKAQEDLRKIQRPAVLYRGYTDDDLLGLRLVDWDGQNDRIYMSDPSMQFMAVEFCPDGERFLAQAYRRGYRFFIYDLNTRAAVDATPLELQVGPGSGSHFPRWSPDGRWIALMGFRRSGRVGDLEDIYKLNVGNGRLINLTNTPEYGKGKPTWSPAGDKIAYPQKPEPEAYKEDIYVMDADGSNCVNLTNTPDAHDQMPVWSPDGKRIVFYSSLWTEFPHYDLFVMDADGTNLQRLTHSPEWDYSPSWAPDSKWILFTSGPYNQGIPWDIYRIHVDTRETVRLTFGNPGGGSGTKVLSGGGRYLQVHPRGQLPTLWAPVKMPDP